MGKGGKRDNTSCIHHSRLRSTRDEDSLFDATSFYSRLIETDAKSLNSLQSGHSRRSSETSQISITSGSSFQDAAAAAGMSPENNAEEDLWTLWAKIINEWELSSKKKLPQIKVTH
jgi:hypothetical protein